MQQGHSQLSDPHECKKSLYGFRCQSWTDLDTGRKKLVSSSPCLSLWKSDLLSVLSIQLSLLSFFILCQLCLDLSSPKCLESNGEQWIHLSAFVIREVFVETASEKLCCLSQSFRSKFACLIEETVDCQNQFYDFIEMQRRPQSSWSTAVFKGKS